MKRLIVFVPAIADAPLRWLHCAEDGALLARGSGAPFPAVDEETVIVAVVPGDAVVLHWIELSAVTEAQALAAARLMASDVVAAPAPGTHVALGPAEAGSAHRVLAITDAGVMWAWLERLAAAGLDPDAVVPAQLLLAAPASGLRVAEHDGLLLVRGDREAFAAEPELAALLIGDRTVERVEADHVWDEAGRIASALPLNLRQGPFAKPHRWRADWTFIRRAAMLGGAIFFIILIGLAANALRHGLAADRIERQIEAEARKALPPEMRVVNAPAQLGQRLTEATGGGAGFLPTASALFAAIRDAGGARVEALRYEPDGRLTATIGMTTAGDGDLIRQHLESAGFTVDQGPQQSGATGLSIELTVRR